jgi:hypothetical protein
MLPCLALAEVNHKHTSGTAPTLLLDDDAAVIHLLLAVVATEVVAAAVTMARAGTAVTPMTGEIETGGGGAGVQ